LRVLLTGAAGFLGQAVLTQLQARHDVTAFDIRADGAGAILQGNVLDYDAVHAAMEGQDAVVNTIMHRYRYDCGGSEFMVNVSGMHNLLEAAHVHGIKRFVHTSSMAVHTGYRPPQMRVTHDLYPLKAWGSYAITKVLQEDLAKLYHDTHGMSVAIIRLRGMVDSERSVDNHGDDVTDYDWGHVDRIDVASALVCALETDDIEFECFYVTATPAGYKVTNVARTEERLGWQPTRMFDVEL